MRDSTLVKVYHRLYNRYGPQGWWPAESKFEIVVGAILTQGVSWMNVVRALDNLKTAGAFSLKGLREIPHGELARLIKPCLYYNVKARKLKAFAEHLWLHHRDDLEAFLTQEPSALRTELLSIYGIGQETADDILLYAAEKPFFVIDAYTRRILKRLDIAPAQESYRAYQALLHRELPRDTEMFNEYHALLDRHAKESCRKRPVCSSCCLLDLCSTGRAGIPPKEAAERTPI